jgi:hypothetical protein
VDALEQTVRVVAPWTPVHDVHVERPRRLDGQLVFMTEARRVARHDLARLAAPRGYEASEMNG